MSDKVCVRCGVEFEYMAVPCPDSELTVRWPGYNGPFLSCGFTCAVLHYGERCPRCGGEVYEARVPAGAAG